jgi:predicted TIM-barrel fold metal-dependent hydrolase
MNYVDAHVHVWTDDFEKYPIAAGYSIDQMKPPTFTPEEVFAHCRPSGVHRIVLIQMSFYGFDNSYMLDVMREYPGVFSGVAVINATSVSPDQEMLRLAENGVRGFRIYPRGAPPASWLQEEGYEKMFTCGAKRDLAMCPLIGVECLRELDRMCAKHPDTPVIIDHLCLIGAGKPIAPGDVDTLCALARHPRAMVKVSAFYALGQDKPAHADLLPLIRSVRDAFGAERLMWASDCPYQVQNETYEDGLAPVRDRCGFLTAEEREQILCNTAEEFFFRP